MSKPDKSGQSEWAVHLRKFCKRKANKAERRWSKKDLKKHEDENKK